MNQMTNDTFTPISMEGLPLTEFDYEKKCQFITILWAGFGVQP